MSGRIYFVTVVTKQEVYAWALGFTHVLHKWGYGENHEQAIAAVVANLKTKDIDVETVGTPSLAHQQNPARYVFPEQICGLPPDVLASAQAAIDERIRASEGAQS